jgi:hypothetical protein
MEEHVHSGSKSAVLLVALTTVALSAAILVALTQMGVVAFIGAGWIVSAFNRISEYLGYSIVFFVPVFLGYVVFFVLLKQSLARSLASHEQMENIRFYNAGTEVCITLSFAIGVLFTAWGLQNALVTAIGGVSEAEAGRLGAWGILKRLVDNGFLIAFWTTIVGGTAGYLMRLFKFLSLGRELGRLAGRQREQDRKALLDTLDAINRHMARMEQNTTRHLWREDHVSGE